jgi:hypothetical protein
MEICMNKLSKVNFIYIEDVDEDHFLAITPNCKTKVLEFELFSDLMVGDATEFLANGMLSESQTRAYEQYQSYRKTDRDEKANRFLESLSKWEIQALIDRYKEKIEKNKQDFTKEGHENENN